LKTVPVTCSPLRKLLAEHQVEVVDYMSLDTEGSELDVLRGIDWTNGPWIDLISVETSSWTYLEAKACKKARGGVGKPGCDRRIKQRKVRAFLQANGYEFLARVGYDDLYRHLGRRGLGDDWVDCSSAPSAASGTFVVSWPMFAAQLGHVLSVVESQKFGKKGDDDVDGQALAEPWTNLGHIVSLTRAIAESDMAEDVCPLAVLASRLIVGLMDDSKVVSRWSGEVMSPLAVSVYRHAQFFSDQQHERMLRSSPPGPAQWTAKWRDRLPLPRLFLADLDFRSTTHGHWPVFETLDLVSRYLHRRVPPIDGFYEFPSKVRAGNLKMAACGLAMGDHEDANQFLERANACGLLAVTNTQVREAAHRFASGNHEEAHARLLAAEQALKTTAQVRGLYWVLFYSGGESPTIWHLLANLSSTLRRTKPL